MGVPEALEGTTKESLRAEIRQLHEQIWEAEHQPNLDHELALNMDLDEWRDRRDHCVAVLNQWNSDDLIREAIAWGIDIPDRADWWTEFISESPSKLQTTKFEWLNPIGLSMISKTGKRRQVGVLEGVGADSSPDPVLTRRHNRVTCEVVTLCPHDHRTLPVWLTPLAGNHFSL